MRLLPLCLLLLALPALAAPPAYVDPRIGVHARQKREHRQPRDARWRSWRGLKAQDTEQVAIYLTQPADSATQAAWARQGVELDPDLWIAPVPGHHALGYHVAQVPYAQLAWLAAQPGVRRIATLEVGTHRHNDQVRKLLNAEFVQAGQGVKATSGAGVKLCIADSSLDTTHEDIPTPTEAYDVTTGNAVGKWQTDVTSQVTEHGTHVTGTAVGSGHWSGGKYRGVAPAASLHFYKIADNATGSSSNADEIRAIHRATTVGCRVFSMSYGELGSELDGGDPTEQALDDAVTKGTAVFISAGNEADGGVHTAVTVGAGESVQVEVTVDNSQGGQALSDPVLFHAAWRDGTPGDDNVTLSISGLGKSETWTDASHWTSTRDTDYHSYEVAPNVAAGATRKWTVKISNKAGGSAATVHLYIDDVNVSTFFADGGIAANTVNSPATADLVVAVGAITQRRTWTDWQGNAQDSGADYVLGQVTTFSSRGPRIDGLRKPDLLAPGSMTISVRDSQIQLDDTTLIDDDGANLDGSGPAHYLAEDGTSMATPAAAGAAALLLAAVPSLSAQQAVQYLTGTANQASAPDNDGGFGLIDVRAAIQQANCDLLGECGQPEADAGTTDVADDASGEAPGPDVPGIAADVATDAAATSGGGGAMASGCAAGGRAASGGWAFAAVCALLALRRRAAKSAATAR